MTLPVYPLESVLEIKRRKVEEAEKVVLERKKELQQEKDKLAKREKERDEVKQHLRDKINQMYEVIEGGTTSPKIQQIRAYIKVVKEKLVAEEKKVEEQKKQVALAEQKLEEAKEDLRMKRQEVDKMEKHRDEWLKEAIREMEIVEGREMDEIGNVTHFIHQKENKAFLKE